jgi:histidinol dehydrogenase
VKVANLRAPEHLEIVTQNPEVVAEGVRHAGAIFLGDDTPEPVGDYIAGPSHVLPTAGTARYASPLGVYDFIRRSSVISYSRDRLNNDGERIIALARADKTDRADEADRADRWTAPSAGRGVVRHVSPCPSRPSCPPRPPCPPCPPCPP